MTTKTLLDGVGATFSADLNLTLGRQSAATTRSFNLSTEDNAALVALSNALPLPTGAATSANQSTLNTNIGSSADAVVANGVAGSIASYLRTIKDQATSTASSSVTIDQTTPGTTDAVTIKSPADVISFTPTLDTAVYAAGDVLFATAAISGVTRANDLRSALMSLTAIDKSKNKPAFTLFFFQTNVTSAAANAANALSDADAVNCLGFVRVLSTDWIDLANNSFACFKGINLLLEAASGTTTVYVVGILDAGTPTFAVGDLVLKLGVVQS